MQEILAKAGAIKDAAEGKRAQDEAAAKRKQLEEKVQAMYDRRTQEMALESSRSSSESELSDIEKALPKLQTDIEQGNAGKAEITMLLAEARQRQDAEAVEGYETLLQKLDDPEAGVAAMQRQLDAMLIRRAELAREESGNREEINASNIAAAKVMREGEKTDNETPNTDYDPAVATAIQEDAAAENASITEKAKEEKTALARKQIELLQEQIATTDQELARLANVRAWYTWDGNITEIDSKLEELQGQLDEYNRSLAALPKNLLGRVRKEDRSKETTLKNNIAKVSEEGPYGQKGENIPERQKARAYQIENRNQAADSLGIGHDATPEMSQDAIKQQITELTANKTNLEAELKKTRERLRNYEGGKDLVIEWTPTERRFLEEHGGREMQVIVKDIAREIKVYSRPGDNSIRVDSSTGRIDGLNSPVAMVANKEYYQALAKDGSKLLFDRLGKELAKELEETVPDFKGTIKIDDKVVLEK